jgi:two-component system, OmpR family, sensor kinase
MRIRTKIFVSHAVLLTTVTLVCFAIVAMLTAKQDDRRQLKTSYEQLRNINLVAAEANRLSEQIAELFILGGQEADILDAREALYGRLAQQRELIEREHLLAGEPGATWGGIDRIQAMEGLVAQIDVSRKELQAHLDAGRRTEAERIYSRDFENRLDRVLGSMIEQAMARERDEVENALDSSQRLSEQSMALAVALVFIVATLGMANVMVLNRTILRPVAALSSGAEAVGRGDLAHVVGSDTADELGQLASRFNAMTRQLKEQRDFLMRAKATLTDEVEARTRDLRERTEELECTNDKLRAIDASRASFFADISHELRTPLTILRGQAEVTLRDPAAEPAELRDALAAVVRKAAQVGRIVDDLLFLARSESGSILVRREAVDLQEVLGDVLLDGADMGSKSGVRILPRQPTEPVIVRGDADRLRQAILIALDNAMKLAPAGSTVEIELRRDNDCAVVAVHDDGPGFTEEEIGSAFTRFYRGRPSPGRSGRGLGLGLSIAKWIVDQHDGMIRIVNARDVGATVEIEVPLAAVAA